MCVCVTAASYITQKEFHCSITTLITGFYSVVGAFTISGIHGLPPYLYFFSDYSQHPLLYPKILAQLKLLLVVPIVVLGAGRLLGLAVEVSVCGCDYGR